MSHELEKARAVIDSIDDQIVALLNQRAEAALTVKKLKQDGAIFRPGREASIVRRVTKASSAMPPTSTEAIYREIIAACRNLEQTLRVSYLGPAGSYSHEAARRLVGSTSELIAEASLRDALHGAEAGRSDAVLLPIENSSEGMVVETHKLLLNADLKIVAETVLDVKHCLLSKATKLSDVTQVYAHPQALGQCREWLQKHLPKAELVTQPSNSRAAELAAQTKHVAAIASAEAATIFDLQVLAQNINDNAANRTRFILLGRQVTAPTGCDKTSLICMVPNRPGTLHVLLAIFAKQGINLIRLESQPTSTTEYAFYLDLDGHQADAPVAAALDLLPSVATTIINLGSYPKATGD